MADRWPRRAVVDIGSNSVRLVIFSGPPRVPVAIMNEKTLCGLGDRESDTGNLRAEAMERALATLRRFRLVIESEQPETLDVFATAAVREAPNGIEFLRVIKSIGFYPKLISGEEEARLAGLGILCSAPEIIRKRRMALGGDLGGGSLELSLLGGPDADIADAGSLPVGALRLLTLFGEDTGAAEDFVAKQLAGLGWIRKLANPTLYVVGGSWRAIARADMARAGHPISILDHYCMTADRTRAICRFVESAEPEALGAIDGVQKKRVPTLPMAAIVLRTLIEAARAERVVVSACGVREGLLFDRLSASVRSEDPLFALAQDLAERQSGGRLPDPDAAFEFISPLFSDPPEMRRLRRAAALMIRMGNITHPDRRPEHAAATIMAAPFLGLGHTERAILAAMVKSRFNGSVGKGDCVIPVNLMTDEQREFAVQVGRAHRLAASLRTPIYSPDPGFALERDSGRLRLRVAARVSDLVAEQAVKDLDRLADAMSLPAEIIQLPDNS